jgi:hypothetical protein
MKRLRWEREESTPKHPYRDTAILYAVFAAVIVVVTAITGGNLLPGDDNGRSGVKGVVAEIGAVLIAGAFFVVATGFSWWRWRVREQEAQRKQ